MIMNKFSGYQSDFTSIRDEQNRVAISYELKLSGNGLYEWYEVYFYKKQKNSISFKDVKDAILDDINKQTDEKILTGFVWNNINVWLSSENQTNFSEAQRMASVKPELVLPVTFKLGETDDETPVYHTFETFEEIDGFYTQAFGYINQCLNEGWQRKDAIDWEPYKAYFHDEEEPVEL